MKEQQKILQPPVMLEHFMQTVTADATYKAKLIHNAETEVQQNIANTK